MNKHVIPLTRRHQLVDLNKDNVNFKLEFQVTAQTPEQEFNTIVLTQDQLDTLDLQKIEMKNAKGKISGTITANNNKYQNYFLVLRKKEETDPDSTVEVGIQLDPLEPGQEVEPEELEASEDEEGDEIQENYSAPETPEVFYKKPWFWVLIAILLVMGGLYYYQYYWKECPQVCNLSPEKVSPVAISTAPAATVPVQTQTQIPVIASSPSPVQGSTSTPFLLDNKDSLLYDKLRDIV